MYIEKIRFKRETKSEWEEGFYVGETEKSENSVILDSKYQPIGRAEDGCRVWRSKIVKGHWFFENK